MINIDSILKKTKKFIKTDECSQLIKEKRIEAFDKGKSFGVSTDGGITNKNAYRGVASGFLNRINPGDNASDALNSIIEQLPNNSQVSQVKKVGKDCYSVNLSFDKDYLYRPSLWTGSYYGDEYTGEGIHNILALFNNGYVLKGRTPFGWWESRDVYLRTVPREKEPLKFMQKSTKEFLNLYKNKYEIKEINLNEVYKN